MNRRTFLASAVTVANAALPAAAASSRFTKSICSIIFPNDLPPADKFRQAKSAGFDAIEMRLEQEIPMESSPDDVKRMGDAAHAGSRSRQVWASQPRANPLNSPDRRCRHGTKKRPGAIDIASWLVRRHPAGARRIEGRKLQTSYMETWDRHSAELPKIILMPPKK
jgi:sugar phosphate isomerase/epimerase